MVIKKSELYEGNSIPITIEGIFQGRGDLVEQSGNTSSPYAITEGKTTRFVRSEIWRVRIGTHEELIKIEYEDD